jgi:hypothetical protein
MVRDVERHIARWPIIARNMKRASDSVFKQATDNFVGHKFRTPDEMWEWWLDRDAPKLDSDPVMFEDDPEL